MINLNLAVALTVIQDMKGEHWKGWLELLDEEGLWAANRMVLGAGTDGGRNRIPTLTVKDPVTKRITKEARSNADKGKLLYQEYFPKRTVPPAVDCIGILVQETWTYTVTTNEQIHRAIKRMKPWKVTRSDTIPNTMFIHTRELLVLHLGLIFRATDVLRVCIPRGLEINRNTYSQETWKV